MELRYPCVCYRKAVCFYKSTTYCFRLVVRLVKESICSFNTVTSLEYCSHCMLSSSLASSEAYSRRRSCGSDSRFSVLLYESK